MKRKIFAVLGVFVLMLSIVTTAYAVVLTYSDTKVEQIATLPSKEIDGVRYTGVGGIAVGRNKNSMFVMKAEKSKDDNSKALSEQSALLYDFPDISKPQEKHYYLLKHAGHANAMAIDKTNIYVCGWSKAEDDGNQQKNEYNNWVLMVPRAMFTSLRKGSNGVFMNKYDRDKPDVPGYSILRPKVKKVLSDGTIKYKDYKRRINTITIHDSNGHFIIGYDMARQYVNNAIATDNEISKDLGHDMAFTTAKLEEYNGKTYFVVSEEVDDVFIVKNNVANKLAVNQDICYAKGHGLFIPKWYGGDKDDGNQYYNRTKTVIMWADIDGAYSTKTVANKSYRYYEPNRIVIDESNAKDSNEKLIYKSFEPESFAFTEDKNGYDGELLFSCNVLKGDSDESNGDGVFKLTHGKNLGFSLK